MAFDDALKSRCMAEMDQRWAHAVDELIRVYATVSPITPSGRPLAGQLRERLRTGDLLGAAELLGGPEVIGLFALMAFDECGLRFARMYDGQDVD